jgi:peptidoglycan/LPS O-acetylase OafA/YrhL
MTPKREFAAIEGLRSLLSFWVVACHACTLSIFFVYAGTPQNSSLLSYMSNSLWTSFAIGLGYQVDVFFMISGFLTSWSLLNQEKGRFTGSIIRDVVLLVFRRLLRLWPAVVVMIIVTYLLGDLYSDNFSVLLSTLTFPISRRLPIAFCVNWSTRVDLQCTVVLFGVFTVMHHFRLLTFSSSVFIACLSMVPKFWRFVTSRSLVSYLSPRYSGNAGDIFLPVLMTAERQEYYTNTLYPGRFDLNIFEDTSPLKQQLMRYEYTVWHQRITPFFIGLVLAIAIKQTLVKPNKSKLFGKILHGFLLGFSLLITLQSLLLPLLKSKAPIQPGDKPPYATDFYVSVLSRPFFALGFAYILYRCLIPSTHTLHCQWLNRVLNLPLLQKLSLYSYGIYTIHFKVLIEVMWRYFPPKVLHAMFGTQASFAPFLFCLLLAYTLSLLCAMAMYHLIELPVQQTIAQPLLKLIDQRSTKAKVT